MQAQAERVEDRQHLGEPNGGLAALQLDEKANSHLCGGSQLVLAEALCKTGLSNDGSDFLSRHMEFPIGKIMPCPIGKDQIFPIGNVWSRYGKNAVSIPDREYSRRICQRRLLRSRRWQSGDAAPRASGPTDRAAGSKAERVEAGGLACLSVHCHRRP